MQGVYFVTGKLGAGKSLVAVGKIRDRLNAGCPVATNLDIRLHKLINPKSKNARLYRVPDKPKAADLEALGSGNDTYDDSKNGLIVLDECGTWFNARNWQDKDRSQLLEWLLHARKLGWDIIFLIQDVSMVDKQARKSVAEHVVYCRRLDRLNFPFVETFIKWFTSGSGIPKPKMHMGIVKYGDLPTSITVDRWFYRGTHLYPAYDTKQSFRDDYPHGLYQVLPPYYSHGRYAVKKDVRFFMRMTKIYLKRFSKVLLLCSGFLVGSLAAAYLYASSEKDKPGETQPEPVHQEQSQQTKIPNWESEPDDEKQKPITIAQRFSGMVINGVAQNNDGEVIYVQIGNDRESWNLNTLRAAGYVVRMVNPCEVLIMNHSRTDHYRVFTSYCPSGS